DMRRELQSISPGSYPKFCSLELIRSKQFPDDWQGNAITCDFRAHRVVRFAMDEKDSGYATREMPDLLRTTNVTFRPIDVKLGPDGALYIADWSNPIIQHGEVDFRDPRRDHEHGRIWRITAKGRPLNKRVNFTKLSNRELLDQLLSPNAYDQQQSRRVLTERGRAVVPELAKWTGNQTNEFALLQALWMYESLDVVQPGLLGKSLNAEDGHIRAAATRVVSYWHPRLNDPLDLLAQLVADKNPRVRVEAVRALAEIPSARSAELVLGALDKPKDPFLDYAIWLSINDLAEPWVAAVKSGEWKSDGREKQLEFALRAVKTSYAGEVLSIELKKRTIARDGSGPWIELIGKSGQEAEVVRLFNQAADGGFDDKAASQALKAVTQAARDRNVGKTGDTEKLAVLFTNSNESIQENALSLAGAWQRKELIPQIGAIIKDKQTKSSVVKAGFDALRDIGGEGGSTQIAQLIKESDDKSVRLEAVLAYATLDMDKAKPYVISTLDDATTEKEASGIWHSVLAIKGASTAIAKALPTTGLPPVMAKAGLREAREGGRNETDLIVALTRGADLESQGLGLTDDDMKKISERAAKEGDATRGETIFRRKEIGCVNCHAIGGVGGKVGPDLTSIGASAQPDYLVESVFYPNRKIKEGYHSVLVETKDGEELSGILVRENSEQLVLRDSTDKEITIAKDKIKGRTLGNSLMPSGLVDSLTTQQQLDLFRFLTELGKPGQFDASKGNIARLWKLWPQTLDLSQFGDEKILNTKLSEDRWTTAFSLVDGHLLKSELDAAIQPVKGRDPAAIFAGATFQVSGSGPFEFKLHGCSAQTPVWLDGKLVKLGLADDGDVWGQATPSAGTHTIIVKLNTAKLPDWIRLDVLGGTFLGN
ncbi:MAG TPA: HEAT repeat domain-containing protein, partial [Verrucomicrobiae bacterium]|nr:HEAT repeat domain-containing protein [Verrucomicrobiae bacterium]